MPWLSKPLCSALSELWVRVVLLRNPQRTEMSIIRKFSSRKIKGTTFPEGFLTRRPHDLTKASGLHSAKRQNPAQTEVACHGYQASMKRHPKVFGDRCQHVQEDVLHLVITLV